MCDKTDDNYPHTFPPDFSLIAIYLYAYMCYKDVNADHSIIQFVPECYKTQEMCNKAVNTCFLGLFMFVIDINLKKCVSVVSEDTFMICMV